MATVKTTAKQAVKKGTRQAVKGGVAWAKWAVGYAVMAAVGGWILATLSGFGIELPFEAAAVGAVAYLAAGTVFLHKRLTPRRVMKAAGKVGLRF